MVYVEHEIVFPVVTS